MVVHSGGVVFTSGSIGETDSLALVKQVAQRVLGWVTAKAALTVPGTGLCRICQPTENRVSLDISTLEADVEIKIQAQLPYLAMAPLYL